ncbi:NADH dehydrogenase [Gossypium australe]|uniref:NAD(P)H-quinone oxidoreductase subunit 5, chloroplastic n=1 Tax=Gossypium australe TaxID=47621 RepID=A0A5B6VA77_9ROSI|nr:NADH dehydrogenase [Gossypium australe]
MEAIVGYSLEKSQNMVFMGGLRKHVPITQIAFLVGTLSLCGIPLLACFWTKDEILSDSWLYSPIFAIIAWSTAGLTTFYMFQIYLLTFEGHLNVHFQKYSVKKSSSSYSIKLWDNTMLFPMIILLLFTLFVGAIAIPFNQEGMHLDILSKLLTPYINLLHQNSNDFEDSYQFFKNATFSVSIACFGIFTAFLLYKPFYSSLQNLNLLNSFVKREEFYWIK